MVDLVLAGDGTYWRKRVELPAAPPAGESVVLVVAPEVVGVVVGSATPFVDDGSVASVLLRGAAAPFPPSYRDVLRREGWSPLL